MSTSTLCDVCKGLIHNNKTSDLVQTPEDFPLFRIVTGRGNGVGDQIDLDLCEACGDDALKVVNAWSVDRSGGDVTVPINLKKQAIASND